MILLNLVPIHLVQESHHGAELVGPVLEEGHGKAGHGLYEGHDEVLLDGLCDGPHDGLQVPQGVQFIAVHCWEREAAKC